VAAGAVLSEIESAAQTPTNPRRIDIHMHFAPPRWITLANQGERTWKGWTPARAIEEMDRAHVASALIAITMPGLTLPAITTVDARRGLARECNDYGAKMVSDYPGRFGLFAMLPMLDVDGSLREIEYVFDTLKADGIGLMTSYEDKWLGDPIFAPIFQELNRRKAIVYTHPTMPSCCVVPEVSNAITELGTDTTRTIMSLIVNKAPSLYPNIPFIFSHAGGIMPFVIERILGRTNIAKLIATPPAPNSLLYELKHFYYDTAGSDNPVSMAGLRKIVPVSQILFGTDFPYGKIAEDAVKNLQECGVFNARELRAIDRENALRLLPRFKA
jgi:6-methylsalicylate decarboxylase